LKAHGEQRSLPAWLWWVTGARAALALTLGVAVLLRDFGRPALANFIAVYWLVGALLTLRWAMAPPSRSRTGIIAALLGAAAALLVLARLPLRHALGADTLLLVLGVAAVMTGVLRLGGGLRDGQLTPAGPRVWRRLVLGALEIVLGAVLILAQDVSRAVALVVSGWGIVAGTMLVLDALAMRRAIRPPR
jgi:hypothetical protein